jgi:hypothetical protein
MTKFMLCWLLILAHAMATVPAWSQEQKDHCETRMTKLDASQAEGSDRLAEKNSVIECRGSQYKHDKMIQGLVKECAKYEQQPIIKQQFVAECRLAAYGYANALYALKTEYGK